MIFLRFRAFWWVLRMPVLAAVWLLWWQDEGKVEKA
jgi:hypothetical protein